MTWLEGPVGIIKAYAKMLPRLQARESLEAVTRFAVGSGTMKQKDRESLVRMWRRTAAGSGSAPRKPHFNLAALAGAGVSIQGIK